MQYGHRFILVCIREYMWLKSEFGVHSEEKDRRNKSKFLFRQQEFSSV